MSKNIDKETALVEAILYLESEPVDEGAVVRISGLSKEAVKAALDNLSAKYAAPQSGLELTRA